MSELMLNHQPVPEARVPIVIRPGTMNDLPFMDELQKKTTRQVGWMPTKQFEGKISAGHVLIATAAERAVGYLVGNDQYFKRDDVGIIYQINVVPEMRRSLVAASLLKAQFERSAYGCKLYCCWCAQDIEANRFWESMGFVPLAFRAGSMTRGVSSEAIGNRKSKIGNVRVHIFWQKRIRANDTTTPWWFPSKTDGGAIRADRIVLPIPPGTRWDEEMPVLLPDERAGTDGLLPEPRNLNPTTSANRAANRKSQIANRESPSRVLSGGMQFARPKPVEPVKQEKPVRQKKPRVKADPKLVSAARELRDRWLEQVNDNPSAMVGQGKYDVSRSIAAQVSDSSQRLLAA